MPTIYDFKINSLQGKEIDFKNFQDHVILIVNTASKCGLTPQYTGLQKLYDTYKEQGLIIIGFPCNQFGGQEPGSAQDIQENCLVNYGVKFLMTEKIDVNGPDTHPIFAYLKEVLPGNGQSSDITWNFNKFLIDTAGNPVQRFDPIVEPGEIEQDIIRLLS
jgi:glutathione peroxidase